MRTTVDVDDDVLQAARELAAARGLTIGQVLSALARKGLEAGDSRSNRTRNGVPLLPRRAPGSPKLTMKRVNELLDDARRARPSSM